MHRGGTDPLLREDYTIPRPLLWYAKDTLSYCAGGLRNPREGRAIREGEGCGDHRAGRLSLEGGAVIFTLCIFH